MTKVKSNNEPKSTEDGDDVIETKIDTTGQGKESKESKDMY